MGMTGFSDAEMALLSGLDAVAWVTRTVLLQCLFDRFGSVFP